MLDRHVNDHIASHELNGKRLSKLELKIIRTHFLEYWRTVENTVKSFSKKLGKGDKRIKELVRGLYQNSPVNRAVFSCIEQYCAVSGLQPHQANFAMETAFGTYYCERAGKDIPNVTPYDRKEFFRRLEALAKSRGQLGLLVPNGATHDQLEAFAAYTFEAVAANARFAQQTSKELEAKHDLVIPLESRGLIAASIAHLDPNLSAYAKHSATSLQRQYDKAIEVVALRAATKPTK